jgi:hypothetical protein
MNANRSLLAQLLSISLVVGLAWSAAAQTPAAPPAKTEPAKTEPGKTEPVKADAAVEPPATVPMKAVPTKPAEDAPFPLVLRIDKSALTKYSDSDVDRKGVVNKMVLGSHCTGESHTTGQIRAELLPDSQEAAFDLYFRGRTVTTTKAVQEPGVCWSRTFTDFTAKRRIIFEPREGFQVVGDDEIETKTSLVYDGFGSTRRFGRRLIERITERKSNQMTGQAIAIADRDNKKEVAESYARESDQQVAAANEGLDLVRYVNNFLGDQDKLQLHAKSTQDFIYIGIGPVGEKYAPMAELPPRQGKRSPIEVWVHASLLSDPVAAAVKLVTPDTPIDLPLQGQIISALAFPVTKKTAPPMDVSLHDGWLVLGMQDEGPKPQAAVAQQTR